MNLLGEQVVNAHALLEHLLPADDLGSSLDEDVDEGGFGLAETVCVRDVIDATFGGRVDTASAAGLQAHLAADILEVGARREERDAHHGASAEASAQVGRAGEDPAVVVVAHEIVALGDQDLLHGLRGLGEAREDGFDVVALLHGDNAHVVFLVDPDEEVGSFVVEDTAGVGPVAAAAGREKKSGVGFLEQVSVVAQRLFLLQGHTVGLGGVRAGAVEREVVTLEISGHLEEAGDDDALELTALLEGAGRGQADAADGAASAGTGGDDEVAVAVGVARGVDLGGGHVLDVHVGGVDGALGPTAVAGRAHGLEEVFELVEAGVVTGNETNGLDHGVPGVVHTSLDADGERHSGGGLLVLVLVVHFGVVAQVVGAEVVVLAEVGELIGAVVSGEGGAALRADVVSVAAAELDPLGKLLDVLGETVRRVVGVRILDRFSLGRGGGHRGGGHRGDLGVGFHLLVKGESGTERGGASHGHTGEHFSRWGGVTCVWTIGVDGRRLGKILCFARKEHDKTRRHEMPRS